MSFVWSRSLIIEAPFFSSLYQVKYHQPPHLTQHPPPGLFEENTILLVYSLANACPPQRGIIFRKILIKAINYSGTL